MTSNKILILLVNWNGKNDTLECLASLEKVAYRHFHTIVIDNGSKDDSVSSIRKAFPHIPIFETKENLGFAGGNNVGISWGLQKGYDWILLLNNDTIVAPDFLDQLMKASHQNPKAKILGAKIYKYHSPLQIDHLGGMWDPSIGEFLSLQSGREDDGISYEEAKQVDYVCGAALLMHRSIPETIGLLEPRFFLFWEETDFCFRAKRAGFEIWTAPQAKIWHKVGASFTGGKPHTHYFWWRSRLLWIARNCSLQEKNKLYRSVILPDLWKTLRHYLLYTLRILAQKILFQRPKEEIKLKQKRNRAGLIGVLHYAMRRFGNCPNTILKTLNPR